MRRRNSFWFAIVLSTIFITAAAPLAALGDNCSCSQTDVGATVAHGIPGLQYAIAAEGFSGTPSGIAFGMVKTLGEDQSISARFLHSYIANVITDLGIEVSDGAINCPNPSYVDLGLARMPGSESDGLLTVAALCDGTIYGSQVVINPNASGARGSDWIKQTFDDAAGMNSMSAASANVDGVLYQTVCGADGSGVYCWDPGAMSGQPALRRQFTAPMGQTFFTSRINHTYDNQGNIHMVGADPGGRLGYAKIPAGGTEAEAASQYWVGDASQNQSWGWPQVGVSPKGTVYISAYNSTEGSLYIFHKESGSVDHWYFNAIGSPDGEVGKYNSLAVDNDTGAAVISYAKPQGMPGAVVVRPDKGVSWATPNGWPIPAGESSINSTATAARNGQYVRHFTSQGVVVGVIDCGIDWSHGDF